MFKKPELQGVHEAVLRGNWSYLFIIITPILVLADLHIYWHPTSLRKWRLQDNTSGPKYQCTEAWNIQLFLCTYTILSPGSFCHQDTVLERCWPSGKSKNVMGIKSPPSCAWMCGKAETYQFCLPQLQTIYWFILSPDLIHRGIAGSSQHETANYITISYTLCGPTRAPKH